MSEPQAVLFYSRCKPHKLGMQQVAIDHRCVFFGHFLHRGDAAYVADDPLSFLVSPAAPADEWTAHHQCSPHNRSIQTENRRLVLEKVGPGSIVMVPWPARGLIYCGRVLGPFRVSFDPLRYTDAAAIFSAAGMDLKEVYASGEVAQGWDVEAWVPLPVPLVPAWIRRSLFGRKTYGVVSSALGAPITPVAMIDSLMARIEEGRAFAPRAWTTTAADVAQRLREAITPSLFEGLVMSLLQLEEPHLAWLGVGGSGDGGIDGVASDDDGDVVAILQCKWAWDGGSVFGQDPVWSETRKLRRRVFAHMTERRGVPDSVDLSWDIATLAELVIKHAGRLPLALSLRVGAPLYHAAGNRGE